jgi:predicted 3-demethylubiquinone-9 3-methyltransferase (glyoxalase superfamily)
MGADMPNLSITPCLWFDGNAEEAVQHYLDVFADGRVVEASRRPDGKPLVIVFELAGRRFQALNGGPEFQFTEALSLSVECDTQREIDELWRKLTSGGGSESQCGWLKDRFGLSWQIVPRVLPRLLQDPNPAKAARVMQAMLGMKKLDIAQLKAAYDRVS